MTEVPLPPDILGDRLRDARRARGISQEAAAAELNVSRPTMIAIEKGRRPPTSAELVRLAQLYGRTVHELTRSAPGVRPLTASFRASAQTPNADTLGPVAELESLAGDVAELEAVTGARLPRTYPEVYEVAGMSADAAAEQVAASERQRLGLGDGPLLQLRGRLETEVGLKVFCYEMPSKIAGLFALAEPVGACVGINSKHPHERQRWTLAHEYAHFLTGNRWITEVTQLPPDGRARRKASGPEQFAEAFAARFLMPAVSVTRRVQSIRRSRDAGFGVADLLHLADEYQTSVQAMAIRLEDLGLIAAGWFHEEVQPRLKVNEARHRLGIARHESDCNLLPRQTEYIAVYAFLQGQITEGMLTKLLRTDRLRAREVVERLSTGVEVDPEGAAINWSLTGDRDDG